VDAGGQDLASCPITATSGETVRDGLTGLIWQRADMPPGHNWQWVTDYCAALSYGGQSDWRLPTAHELRSILDYSRTDPAIDEAVFPTYNSGSSPTANFWSSSSTTANTNLAWFVGFQEGSTGDDDKNNNYHIRCVRSPSGGSISPPNRFTQNTTQGEVVVIDSLTGLMWQHTTVSAITWQEALAYCETLSYAGSDDWRLPNVNSLASMVDYARASPASDFPNMPNQYFWSSSTSARTTSWGMNVAWYVDFDSGDVSSNFKSRNYDVRCVR